MKRKILVLLMLTSFSVISVFAQSSFGSLKGLVVDQETGEPMIFTNVVLLQDGVQVKGTTTDMDGNYTLKPIAAGNYNLVVKFTGYTDVIVENISVNANKITFHNAKLTRTSIEYGEAIVMEYIRPLIEFDRPNVTIVTAKEIAKMAEKDFHKIIELAPGVMDGSFRGQRTNSDAIFVDGIRVRGDLSVPMCSVQEIQTITGGVPAEYGDILGGVVIITTKSALR